MASASRVHDTRLFSSNQMAIISDRACTASVGYLSSRLRSLEKLTPSLTPKLNQSLRSFTHFLTSSNVGPGTALIAARTYTPGPCSVNSSANPAVNPSNRKKTTESAILNNFAWVKIHFSSSVCFGGDASLPFKRFLKMSKANAEMEKEVDEKVDGFITYLKQKNPHSSYDVARRTVLLLREMCSKTRWMNTRELIERIAAEGRKLIAAQPSESAVGNMVRRVLNIIREEHNSCVGKVEEMDVKDSLHILLLGKGDTDDLSRHVPNLKGSIIETINDLLGELELSASNISSQALEHIHSNEVLMTTGYSKTVEAFLKAAARKRRFEVIVAECAPFCQGQRMARNLAMAGIETILVTDSAVFAIMSRVNKVIIGTHTVMADGSLKAINGSYALALAAKHHSVPVLVCAALFKLSPQYPCSYDHDTFNKIVSPHNLLSFSAGQLMSRVHVQNPVFDHVPPDLITLFISNIGGNAPSYVYRLISELYHSDDQELL